MCNKASDRLRFRLILLLLQSRVCICPELSVIVSDLDSLNEAPCSCQHGLRVGFSSLSSSVFHLWTGVGVGLPAGASGADVN